MAKVKIKLVGNWDAWGPGAREGQMTRGDGDHSRVLVRITPGGADPGAAKMREEARVIGRIRDPQILRLLHMNVVQGQVLRVYEGFEGASLAVILRAQLGASAQVPVRVALEVGHAVGRALQAVEGGLPGDSARVVHPGPDPQNVLVDAHGRVKLAGLAASSSLSAAPDDPPSPYLPPEGLLGEAVASYQVGALIAELLAGEPPTRAGADRDSHEAMLRRIMIRVLARPGDPAREGVVSTVRSCLAFEPTERPALSALVETLGQLGRDAAMPGLRAWCAGVVPGVLRASQSPVDRRPLAAPATEEVPLVRPVSSPMAAGQGVAGEGVLPLPADDGRLPVSIGPLVPDDEEEDLAPTTVLPAEERDRVIAALSEGVAPAAAEPTTTSMATERVSPVASQVSAEAPAVDRGAANIAAGGAESHQVRPVDVDVRAGSEGGAAAALNIALDDAPDDPPPHSGRGIGLLLLVGLLGASVLILGAGAWWWFNERPVASAPQADVVGTQDAEPASATLAQEEPTAPADVTPEGDDTGEADATTAEGLGSPAPEAAVTPEDEPPQTQDAPPAAAKSDAKYSKPPRPRHSSTHRTPRPEASAATVDDTPEVTARIVPTTAPEDATPAEQPTAPAEQPAAPAEQPAALAEAPAAAVPPPAAPVASDTFKVVFRSADPAVTQIDVHCHVGSGHGPSPVIIEDAGRGPCKVTGHTATGRLIVMVSLVGEHEFACFEAGARSCH